MALSSGGTSEILMCLYAETTNGTRDTRIETETEAHLERKGTPRDGTGWRAGKVWDLMTLHRPFIQPCDTFGEHMWFFIFVFRFSL